MRGHTRDAWMGLSGHQQLFQGIDQVPDRFGPKTFDPPMPPGQPFEPRSVWRLGQGYQKLGQVGAETVELRADHRHEVGGRRGVGVGWLAQSVLLNLDGGIDLSLVEVAHRARGKRLHTRLLGSRSDSDDRFVENPELSWSIPHGLIVGSLPFRYLGHQGEPLPHHLDERFERCRVGC